MEASECALTRGTCFIARRLEVVAFAGLMWNSWCVLGAGDIFRIFLVFRLFFFFESTRPVASMRPPCLVYLSRSILRIVCVLCESTHRSNPHEAARRSKTLALCPWVEDEETMNRQPRKHEADKCKRETRKP